MLLRLLLLGALACGAEEAATPEPTPEPVQEEPEVEEEEELDEEDELDEAPPSFTTSELDAMERPELEQACFAGSQAACDRLGH